MHEEFHESSENVDAALKYWDEDRKNEYEQLHTLLYKKTITPDLRKRVGSFLLVLVKETYHQLDSIQDTLHRMDTFGQYSFDDALDDIFKRVHELNSRGHSSTETFRGWNKLRAMIGEYSKK
ncbi:hypothetical protein KW805_00625 [Candidatus Pacearchaeota archaeon]|nr:hypothetical protein [Candidatus Pacearchaeota archaeon]